MEKTPERIQKYLSALKEESRLSWADLSEKTGLPDSTIRKIFSGNTLDPRLETISQIVFAMNGSLDDMLRDTDSPPQPPDSKAELETLRAFGTEHMQQSYEKRLDEKEASLQQYIASLKRDKMILFVLCCALTTILILFFLADIFLGSVGWIRY